MTERLTSPKVVRDLLRRHGLNARKKYGQNFLVDDNTLQKIVAAAGLSEQAQVLEIGPGLGTLTRELAASAARVYAVEVDTGLQPLLKETLGDLNNVELFFADALKLDLNTVFHAGAPRFVVANLPYYITSPLLIALLNLQPAAERMVFLVQREVGERLTAAPGSKLYGSLTVLAQALARVEVVSLVSPQVFYPVPDVESIIVAMEPLSIQESGIASRRSFELTNRAVFGQRRKTLLNALKGSPHWEIGASAIEAALVSQGLDPAQRGEQLSVQQIVSLSNELARYLE